MESYEIVELFESIWNESPKKTPFAVHDNKKVIFGLFLQVQDLRVHIQLAVGVKGGVSEVVVVVDPKPRITADRLVAAAGDGGEGSRGLLLPLSSLRLQIRQSRGGRREVALQLCERAMQEFVDGLNARPLKASDLRSLPLSDDSIVAIAAGLPSFGKRGGGAGKKS